MQRVLTTLAIAAFAAIAGATGITPILAAQGNDPAATRKLHELGYPTDGKLAIQRWRLDTGRTGEGPLNPDEKAALLAQPAPEHLGAMAGNPFTGLGLALKHKTRAEAERNAIRLCRAQGGGDSCVQPTVIRADQCVAVVGYEVTIDSRPVYRRSVAVSNEVARSLEAASKACPIGASHPELCKPLLTFCGDGRELQQFEDGKPVEKSAEATTAPR